MIRRSACGVAPSLPRRKGAPGRRAETLVRPYGESPFERNAEGAAVWMVFFDKSLRIWDTDEKADLKKREYYNSPSNRTIRALALYETGDYHGFIKEETRLYLRHGRCDLSRQRPLAGRAGVCALALPGEEELPVPDELQPVHPQGTPAEAGPDGPGRGRVPLLHKRPGHRLFSGQPGPRVQRLCGGRAWRHERTTWWWESPLPTIWNRSPRPSVW